MSNNVIWAYPSDSLSSSSEKRGIKRVRIMIETPCANIPRTGAYENQGSCCLCRCWCCDGTIRRFKPSTAGIENGAPHIDLSMAEDIQGVLKKGTSLYAQKKIDAMDMKLVLLKNNRIGQVQITYQTHGRGRWWRKNSSTYSYDNIESDPTRDTRYRCNLGGRT